MARPARPALDVVGRFGRHAGEHHGREVADVDAHFEGGGGGNDVGGVGGVAGLECGFEVFAFGSAEHAGVFAGDGAAGPAGAVEAAVVVIVLGGQQFEVAGAAVAQAVCAFPPVGAVGWGGVACSAGVAAEQ